MKDRLGNHIQQVRGVSYKPSDLSENLSDGYTVLLRANNISEGRINFDSVQFVRNNKISQEQILKTNDILVCSSSGSISLVGKSALYKKSGEHTFGAFCKVVRATGKLHPQFIAFYMCSQAYRKHIEHIANGANINNLRNEHLDEIQLDIPTDDQQKVIISKLEKIQSIITHRRTQLSKLDELIKCRFVEMFGDPVDNPRGWETKGLLELGKCKNGMNFSAGESGVNVHCLGVGDFKDYSEICNTSVLPKISLNKMPPEEVMLQDGDIVFVRSNGNKMLVGRCLVIFPGDIPTTYSGFCIRFRKEAECVDTTYLVQLLKADSTRSKMAGRGANIQNLNQQILGALQIPIPPIELQQEFKDFIKQSDKFKFVIQQSLDETQKLFDSFMQEYFDS